MGLLLKEALKCLCSENGWSYAVFWKIGDQNPTILVWEECHYEPAQYSSLQGVSGSESTEMLLKEWQGLSNSPKGRVSRVEFEVEDKVHSLINKMMMHNQVHVVGEGIVGRAAFTGAHLWILRENHMGDDHPSEVLAEVNHQFLAGMQTIAVIPLLPHGVLQLGSTLAIMEKMGFVNSVKNLFANLASVPSALLSNNYAKKEPEQKIGGPISFGIPVSADQAISKMEKFAPLIGVNCNQQIPTFQESRLVSQTHHSLSTQIQGNMHSSALTFQTTPSLAPTMAKSLNDLFQQKDLPAMRPNLPLRNQQTTGPIRSQVVLSNSGRPLNQQCYPYNPGSRFNHEPTAGQSDVTCSGLTFMEQQILSDNGLQESFNNSLHASAQLGTNEATIPNSLKDSVIAQLLGGSELPHAGSGLETLTSVPCSRSIPYISADSNSSCPPLEGIELRFGNLSNMKVVSSSNHNAYHLNKSDMLPGCSHQSHPFINNKQTQTDFGTVQGIEKDLFQALNISPAHQGEHISRHGSITGVLQDCCVSSPKHESKTHPISQHVVCEDELVRPPSGEDLFDILGIDFKSKQLSCSWNDFCKHGADASAQSLSTDVSTCITQLDASSGFYSLNDGISESGIFSESGADHLLDAVVSKFHSASKQNSDDSVSCWTTLSKVSSSSVPMGSTYSQVGVSDQMKKDTFGISPPPSKSDIVGSSSFTSKCSKDNVGGCQINPMYRSQTGLWVEDGPNMKDNSISTARSKRPDEMGKANRKRLRPGESPRPRPKDRQMIQDRVKELREIVPNGAKCSIDALLERTIKHMLFLQCVTKHADKLKQTGESKIINKEGGGATWAYEVGSQSTICPIIVEDLNLPRQMLVEMLCEERGFFLEIAVIIRGLGLTILKGEMEARNDKVWAHFVVEANRDVTRVEIFLSLVHLLEQAGMSRLPAGIDSNMMVQDTFHQASLPATGQCNSLQ